MYLYFVCSLNFGKNYFFHKRRTIWRFFFYFCFFLHFIKFVFVRNTLQTCHCFLQRNRCLQIVVSHSTYVTVRIVNYSFKNVLVLLSNIYNTFLWNLPLVFYKKHQSFESFFKLLWKISSIRYWFWLEMWLCEMLLQQKLQNCT